MSTIKISQLANLPSIAANTSNTLFVGVDLPSDTTGKFTATTLAQQLYANNQLAVGNNLIVFSNTVAQFSGYDPSFLQTNLQNFNGSGSSDYIATADIGTNINNYIDLGINGSGDYDSVNSSAYYPLDGYVYAQGNTANPIGGNLIIGTATTGTHIKFTIGGQNNANTVARFYSNGAAVFSGNVVVQSGGGVMFNDRTLQTTAAASNAYSVAAFATANSAQANTIITQGVDAGQNSAISIIQGVDLGQNTLIASAQANTVYLQGALITANANSAMNMANISYIMGIETTQNTLISSAQANTIITQGVDAWQNNNIQLAWNEANTSIQNTANIIIPGNEIGRAHV